MSEALVLKLTLSKTQPVVWRDLVIPLDATYEQLYQWLLVTFDNVDHDAYHFIAQTTPPVTYASRDSHWRAKADGHDPVHFHVYADLFRAAVDCFAEAKQPWSVHIELREQTEIDGVLPQVLAGAGQAIFADDEPFDLEEINLELADPDFDGLELTAHEDLVDLLSERFERQWALFELSKERKTLADISSAHLRLYLLTFAVAMAEDAVQKWTLSGVHATLHEQVQALADDPVTQQAMVSIIGDFLVVMARHHELAGNVSERQMTQMLGKLIVDDELEFNLGEKEHVNQLLDELMARYGEELEGFYRTPQFDTFELDIDEANVLLMNFILNMVTKYHQWLDEWQSQAIIELLVNVYPQHMDYTRSQWEALPGLLSDFVGYLHDHKQLSTKQTTRIQKTLRNNTEDMLDALQLQTELTILDDPGHYQVPDHVETADGRRWDEELAEAVHNQVLDQSMTLFQTESPREVLIQFVDEIYAKFLLVPEGWTPRVIGPAWLKHLEPLTSDERLADTQALLTFLATLQAPEALVDAVKKAEQIVSADVKRPK